MNCCGFMIRFVQIANLRRHLRVHTGEKPYACEVPSCNSKFSDSNQLKAHMLIHRGEKPYRCEKCSGVYRRRHHLNHHKCPMDQANAGRPRRGRRPRAYDSSSGANASSLEMSTAMSITPPPPAGQSVLGLDSNTGCSVSNSPALLMNASSLFTGSAPSAIVSTPDSHQSSSLSSTNALSGLLSAAAASAAATSGSNANNVGAGFGSLSTNDLNVNGGLAGFNQLSGHLAALAASNPLLMAAAAVNQSNIASPIINAIMNNNNAGHISPVSAAGQSILSRSLGKQRSSAGNSNTIHSTTTAINNNLTLNSSHDSSAASPRPSSTSAVVSTSLPSASSTTNLLNGSGSHQLHLSSHSPVSSSSTSNSTNVAAVAAAVNSAQQFTSQLLQQQAALGSLSGLSGLSSLINPYSMLDQRLLSSLLQPNAAVNAPISLAPTSTTSAAPNLSHLTGLSQFNMNQLNQISQMSQQLDQLRQLNQMNQLNQLGGLLNLGASNTIKSPDTPTPNPLISDSDASSVDQPKSRRTKSKASMKRMPTLPQSHSITVPAPLPPPSSKTTTTNTDMNMDLMMNGQLNSKFDTIFGQIDLDKLASNRNHLPIDFSTTGKQSPPQLTATPNITHNNNNHNHNNYNSSTPVVSGHGAALDLSRSRSDAGSDPEDEMETEKRLAKMNSIGHTFGQLSQTDLLGNFMSQQLLMNQLQRQQQRVPPTPAGSEPEASNDEDDEEEEDETDDHKSITHNNNNDDMLMDCDMQHQAVRQQHHHLNGFRKAAALLDVFATQHSPSVKGNAVNTAHLGEPIAFTAEQLDLLYRKRPIAGSSPNDSSSLQNIVPSHLLDRAKNLTLNGTGHSVTSGFGDTTAAEAASLTGSLFEKMLLQKQQQLADVNMLMMPSDGNSRPNSPGSATASMAAAVRGSLRNLQRHIDHNANDTSTSIVASIAKS